MTMKEILYYVPLKTGGFAAMTLEQIGNNLDKIAGVEPAKEPETPSRNEQAGISKGDSAE